MKITPASNNSDITLSPPRQADNVNHARFSGANSCLFLATPPEQIREYSEQNQAVECREACLACGNYFQPA
ncbi:MAG: hypothetical protein OEM03_12940, partial [Chromatiales bacterium]|nr:hypothetical protein [Chromatiales bacterium]